MHSIRSSLELMAPVGSFETLAAAIKAGADSVYFGVGKLNMRSASAVNFTEADLKKIVKICKKANVRTYLTLNSVMYDDDLKDMRKASDAAKKHGVDAIIACDMSVIQYARSIGMRVHLSTQSNVSNIEAVKFFSRYADVIILARELDLAQIKNICTAIKRRQITGPSGELVRIEVFVHGALCVSISGKCYMSLSTYNKSANRGACLQNCRRAYKVTDVETGDELVIEGRHVMSPSDLCTIGMLDKLIETGASVFKIEGRGRKAEYVYKTVKVYKEAIESVKQGTYSPEKAARWKTELESVYNRGFWHGGYYLGEKTGEWSEGNGSKATLTKEYVAKCLNYYPKAKVGFFLMESGRLSIGDSILVTGPTTGVVESIVGELLRERKGEKAKMGQGVRKGDLFTMPVPERVRKNDKLFLLVKRE